MLTYQKPWADYILWIDLMALLPLLVRVFLVSCLAGSNRRPRGGTCGVFAHLRHAHRARSDGGGPIRARERG